MPDVPKTTEAVEVTLTLPQNQQYDMVMQDLEGKLVGSFGGFTKHQARGVYRMADGADCYESVVLYKVLVSSEVFDQQWWYDYAEMLRDSLKQEAVLVQFTITSMRLV